MFPNIPSTSYFRGKNEKVYVYFYPPNESYWACLGQDITSKGDCFLFVSVNYADPNYEKSRKVQFEKKCSKLGFILKTL